MRARFVGVMALCAATALGGAAFAQERAQTPAPSTPTPATPGPNPGASATDAVTSPARPPAEVVPGGAVPATRQPLPDTTRPETPTRPDGRQGSVRPENDRTRLAAPAAAVAQDEMAPRGSLPTTEMNDLLASAREIAKATRENVDYSRVLPDILTQVLAKLDKLEDKLDKVENAVKAPGPRRR